MKNQTNNTKMHFAFTGALLALALAGAAAAGTIEDTHYLSQLDKKYPGDGASTGQPAFFDVPAVKKTFNKIVPADWRRAVKDELRTGVPNAVIDNHLLVSACKSHDCPTKSYVAVVRLTDNAMFFVFRQAKVGAEKSNGTFCFATTEKDLKRLPEAVSTALADRLGLTEAKTVSAIVCRTGSR